MFKLTQHPVLKRLRPWLALWLWTLLGILLSLWGYQKIQRLEYDRQHTQFNALAYQEHERFQREIDSAFQRLDGLRTLVEMVLDNRDSLPPNTLRGFAMHSLRSHPWMLTLQWTPRVPVEEKATFEARMSEEVPGFSITPLDGESDHDRHYLYPIQYSISLYDNPVIGKDAGSRVQSRLAMNHAFRSQMVGVTEPFRLTQTGRTGVVAYMPVFRLDAPRGTELQRHRALLGYVGMVIRTRMLARQAWESMRNTGLSGILTDRIAGPDNRLLGSNLVLQGDTGGVRQHPWQLKLPLEVPGRGWQLTLVPDDNFFVAHARRDARNFLVAALLITVLTTLYLYHRISDELRLREVTGQLRKTNKALVTHSRNLASAREETREKVREKSAFVVNMSNGLYSPMNAISGLLHLFQSTELNDQQKGYLFKLGQANQQLKTHLDDVLDYAKIESGMMSIEDAAFSLEEMLQDVADSMLGLAREKGLTLDVELDPDTPAEIQGDQAKIRQILVNLLSNAIKFTEHGFIYVRAEGHSTNIGRYRLALDVKDSGIGIAPDRLEQLMQPLPCIDANATHHPLGLEITRRLAQLMGGSMTVQSQPGQGSFFRVELMVDSLPEPDWFRDIRGRLYGRNMLVLTRDEHLQAAACAYLARFGINPMPLPSGNALTGHLTTRIEQSRVPYLGLLIDEYSLENYSDSLVPLIGDERLPSLFVAGWPGQSLDDWMAENSWAQAARLERPLGIRNMLKALCQTDISLRHLIPDTGGTFDVRPYWNGVSALVVENDPINAQVVRELLSGCGFSVTQALGGREALEAAEHVTRFDLVMLDMHTPGMDALTLASEVRKIKGYERVPILAMSGNALEQEVHACMDAGINAYLAKPIDIPNFWRTLRTTMPDA